MVSVKDPPKSLFRLYVSLCMVMSLLVVVVVEASGFRRAV